MMTPKNGAIDGRLEFKTYKSAKAECNFLADLILSEWVPKLQGLEKPKDRDQIIGLFPNKDVLKQYKKELKKRNIDCLVRDGTCDANAFRLTNYLMLAYYRGHPLYDRYLLYDFKAISKKYPSLIWDKVKAGASIADAVQQLINGKALTPKPQKEAKDFLEKRQALTSGDADRIKAAIHWDVDTADIGQLLECKNRTDADIIIATIREKALKAAEEVECEAPAVPIRLMTMHGCKGLTKKFVFIPGLEQCWMPGDATGERLAEQKRLIYVAITRSWDEVVITCPKTRARGDSLNYSKLGRGKLSGVCRLFGINVVDVP
jgi:superfamily I DNA/RNA helicase